MVRICIGICGPLLKTLTGVIRISVLSRYSDNDYLEAKRANRELLKFETDQEVFESWSSSTYKVKSRRSIGVFWHLQHQGSI